MLCRILSTWVAGENGTSVRKRIADCSRVSTDPSTLLLRFNVRRMSEIFNLRYIRTFREISEVVSVGFKLQPIFRISTIVVFKTQYVCLDNVVLKFGS